MSTRADLARIGWLVWFRRTLRGGPRRRLILFAGLALAGGGAASAAAVGFVSRQNSPLPLDTRGIAIIRLGTSYSPEQNYNRYSYVIVGVANARAAGALRAKSFVYMSGTSVKDSFFTGVTYDQARRQGWLLKDAAGNYLKSTHYKAYIGDIGSLAYQKGWADNVARFVTRNRDDGVFIDDVIADAGQLIDGAYPAKYPNQRAWQNAQLSFIRYVGPALKAKGFYVLVSAIAFISGDDRSNNGQLTSLFWKQLAPSVSGLFSEYWLQLPSETAKVRPAGSSDWNQWWGGWQNLVNVAEEAGVDFFAEMYGPVDNTSVMRYGKASFLLDWNGKGGAFVYQPYRQGDRADPWNPEWTMQVGRPAAPKFRVGVGWRRNYTAGVALVNPSATTSQTFVLGGTYYRPDGARVISITLDPTSGIILRR